MGFIAETGSGHILAMDGAQDGAEPDQGGQNLAPRPLEMLLAGAGGCTAYDVVLILRRSRLQVRSCSVQLDAERASVDPKVFTQINLHFRICAKGLTEAVARRAIELSRDKYCSALAMLCKTAKIHTSFEIQELE